MAPEPEPPRLTISGVEDGATYNGPVTIQISVDRGTIEATVNGLAFLPGGTVTASGEHLLRVTARHGAATVREELRFSIGAPPLTGESILIVRMLDLGLGLGAGTGTSGSGDAIVLTDSSAAGIRHAVIDAGPFGSGTTVDYAFVANRLQSLGVDTLEFMQLTHAHADHYGAMQEVLQRVHVREFVYNGQIRSVTGYRNALTAAQMHAGSVVVPATVREHLLGAGSTRTRLQTIPPLPTYIGTDTNDGGELNEGSLGTALTRGSFRMFFTGDGEYEANQRWRTQFSGHTQNLTVLKVGHHGANNAIFDTGTTGPSTWLTHTSPRVSIISANGVSHPRVRALERLRGLPEHRTYCTSVHGTIEIRVNPVGEYRVRVQKNEAADCAAGTEATT